MATIGACIFSADLSPLFRKDMTPASAKPKRNPIINKLAVSTEQATTATKTTSRRSFAETKIKKSDAEGERIQILSAKELEEYEAKRKSLKDYFDQAIEMIRSDGCSGPPCWFSPLECESRTPDSPLLLYLPGMDGVGLGLLRQHQTLGKIFDIWCLHIPVKDRTSFTGLVKIIERGLRSENERSPNSPIYLVGESLGACLALAVAARNPDIDLVLILANPATSFNKSMLQSAIPLMELMPGHVTLSLSYMLSLVRGDPLKIAMDKVVKGFSRRPTVEGLSQDLVAMSQYLPVLADILPKETLLWKLELLKSASAYANARLYDVKAQTLILCSGKDQLLPSKEEGQRLRHALPKCETRNFDNNGHFLFLEDGVDLVTIIKGTAFYRRGKTVDYVSDFMPPTITEFNRIYENNSLISNVTSPVMLSTLEDGKIVRGLSGIPAEGPVLYVGYHMLLGLELSSMIPQFMIERNILIRGVAHPMIFFNVKENGASPNLDTIYDTMRVMGAVPVSANNLYKLLASKSHVLLYPGGMREACHRKGEEYKLFWPENSEFVRMAATFGAKIVPFGAVGEDDVAQVVFDYDDQMKIPCFRSQIEEWTKVTVKLGSNRKGEVANQPVHFPYFIPKVPAGRFYYYFGKPIETQGRKRELRDREKAQELYLEVKSEVEKCLTYLREKRETDLYRSILPRSIYQATHGFTSQVPTFEI